MSKKISKKSVRPTNDSIQFKDAKTLDGFTNFVAKLGLQQRNALSAGTYDFNLITRNRIKLEAAYRGSWIVRRVCNSVAKDMVRAGINITTSEDDENISKLQSAMSRLQVWQSLESVISWSRLYGGSIGVIQIDGQDLATPLDPSSVGKDQFLGIVVYDRWQLNPSVSEVIEKGPEMGLPKYYEITTNNNINDPAKQTEGGLKIHHTRCVRGGGIKLPFFQAITEMMWGESVIENLYDRLISFDTASMAAANLINRASLRTVKIKDYREIVSGGGEMMDGLIAQFEAMKEFQTNEGLTIIDMEDDIQFDTYTFTGLPESVLLQAQQLSGAAEVPLVVLFCQSPQGLNATGDSDIRMYYDNINADQNSMLRNPLEMIISVMYRSEFGKDKPKDLEFTFNPLWQMTPLDKATISKTHTETILGAEAAGVIDKATAQKELRTISGDTGIFSAITDEMIAESENEEPPMPEVDPSAEGNTGAIPKEPNLSVVKNIDSGTLIKRFLKRFKG